MALSVFLLNVLVNAPLFMPGDLPFRGSIEAGYVGMARFLSEHPNPWGWNPLPYCGLPTQFMYVPNLPYVAALFMHLVPHAAPDTVFRTIVSLMTCLGPVTLFFFALYFTGSRKWAFATAIVYSLLSPSYALFPAVEKDRGIAQMAWRVKVLAKYGEGPHNTGLTLLPLALLALWRAAKGRGYPLILGSALLLAAIPLTNWVAAFGLAISCALMLLAAPGETDFRYARTLAAAGLAYLLACFWLTPSFVKTIAFNWPVDSYAYKVHQMQAWSLAGMIGSIVVVRAAFWFLGGSFYFRFVTLCSIAFGWVATAYYVFGLDTVPESHRYAIEFELFLALAVMEAFRLTLRNPNSTVRLCAMGTAGVMLLVGAPQLWAIATQGWDAWAPAPPESSIEYQLAHWIDQHPPVGRVFATGGLRFRLNSWFDIPQIGGGFETGLQDRIPVDVAYHIRVGNGPWRGHEGEETLLELKALGAQYVVIHGAKSREYYHDFLRTERITANLQPVFHIEDDSIYALPVRSLAHLIRPEELPNANVVLYPQSLSRYVAAIEDASRPLIKLEWKDASTLTVSGDVRAGELIALQINSAPGWRALQEGREVPIETDRLGFMVLHPAASPSTQIEVHYRGTGEQRAMAAISVLSWLSALGAFLWVSGKRVV
jgi:hypothetical protein